MKKSVMPRPVLPFHIIFTEYVPAWTVPVVNSIQLPVFSASSEIHWPLLEFASVCVEWPVPLSVTARFSASNETVVPPPPPPPLGEPSRQNLMPDHSAVMGPCPLPRRKVPYLS